MINLTKAKSLARVTQEWDKVAALREKQVRSGKDHSANFVLAPAILRQIPRSRSLLDIGCGTGWLTSRAAKLAEVTVGIDPSKMSIEIANSENTGIAVSYYAESVERYSRSGRRFDTAISNMAASSAPHLNTFISASRKLLKKQGVYVITIPHPCFWPIYWGYISDPRFNYQRMLAVEGEFRIQEETSKFLTTHFHRPLAGYIDAITGSGFRIEAIQELTGRGFPLPRFMVIKARAV